MALTQQEKKETSFARNRYVYEPKCTYPILRIWLPLWLHIPIYRKVYNSGRVHYSFLNLLGAPSKQGRPLFEGAY